MKVCTTCKEERPIEAFYSYQTKDRGPRVAPSCRFCARAYKKSVRVRDAKRISQHKKAFYQANRDEIKARSNAFYHQNKEAIQLRRRALRYGLSEDEIQDMLRRTKFCPICGTDRPGGPHGTEWNIDHCHDTGKVRGVLCCTCNLMLGLVKDDPAVLAAGIQYLQRG